MESVLNFITRKGCFISDQAYQKLKKFMKLYEFTIDDFYDAMKQLDEELFENYRVLYRTNINLIQQFMLETLDDEDEEEEEYIKTKSNHFKGMNDEKIKEKLKVALNKPCVFYEYKNDSPISKTINFNPEEVNKLIQEYINYIGVTDDTIEEVLRLKNIENDVIFDEVGKYFTLID